jgi:hypothetical protein
MTWPIPICLGPRVTIIKDVSSFVSLSGPSSNPVASSTAASYCVTDAPPNGKVYKFVPNASGVGDLRNELSLSLYPNPTPGMFTITSESYSNTEVNISIKNNLGQEVYAEKTFLRSVGLNVNPKLEQGLYFIEIGNEQSRTVRKIIVE